MNGPTPTSSTAVLPSREETLQEIEASGAMPLSLMFFASLLWLVIGGVFALIASVKLHSPLILADCSWLSYGHDKAAANDALAYGFASQAGLATALWMLCRLGRTRLFGPISITIAAVFWNIGLVLGIAGILRGDTTGFEWMEFPGYGSALFFAAFLVIAICALVTFAQRKVRDLYPSQWYILGALLWLPWVYSTARLLLVWSPVRGVMQFLIQNWFANGLLTLWLGALGIAVLYYFIPKLTTGELYSRQLAVFGFWTFAVFAPWGGLYRGVPLPSWIVSVSIAGATLTLVPLVAVVLNLWESRRAPALECSRVWFSTSLLFFALSGLLRIAIALCPVSALTVVSEAAQVVMFYGFLGFALFGALLEIGPRITGAAVLKPGSARLAWWCTTLGILFFSGALLAGGLAQGHKLRVGTVAFTDVMNGLKPWERVSTLGLLLLVVGSLAILCAFGGMLRQCCRNCCSCADEPAGTAKLKPAKAR